MTQHVRLAGRRREKKNVDAKEGWEDGRPPPHTDGAGILFCAQCAPGPCLFSRQNLSREFSHLLWAWWAGQNGRTTISTAMLPITEEPSFCVPTAALIETARRSWDALFPGEEVPQFDTEEAFLAWANSAQLGSGHSPPPPVFLAEAAPQPAPRVGSGRGARSPNGARRQQSPASLPQPRGSAAAQPPDARATVRVEDASGMSWEHGSVARAVPRSAAHRLSAPPP